jgi:hypothetical protein
VVVVMMMMMMMMIMIMMLARVTPDLSTRAVLPAETSQASKRNGRRNEHFAYPIHYFDTSTDLLHAVKSYDMGPTALLPVRRKVCCGFLSPLKIHRLGWV